MNLPVTLFQSNVYFGGFAVVALFTWVPEAKY